MRIAITHDWLDTWGGAELALAEMLALFPDADLYTLVDFMTPEYRARLRPRTTHTSFIQRLPFARTAFRRYLPLFPRAIEQFDLSAYDLVISSSHAVAKGARTTPAQLHICYCYTPMRYAWDLHDQYLSQVGLDKGVRGRVVRGSLARLRRWDRAASERVGQFVAISDTIAQRIFRCYGRDSTVIYPPVALPAQSAEATRDTAYVTVSRMVPYKRVDLIVEAFRLLPDRRLVVIGDGPERDRIAAAAGPNVELLGPRAGRRARPMAGNGARLRVRGGRGLRHRAAGSAGARHAGDRLRPWRIAGNDPGTRNRRTHRRAVRGADARGDRRGRARVRIQCASFHACRVPRECSAIFGRSVPQRIRRVRCGTTVGIRESRRGCVVRKSLLKANAPLFEWLVRLFDPLLAILAGWLAYRWYLGTWILPERYLLALIGVAIFCFALFPLLRLYSPQRGVTLFEEIGRLVNAWLLLAAAWFGYLFLSKSGADFSRAWSLYWIGFGAAMHFASRAAIRLVLRSLRRRGHNLRHVIIVGAGRLGQDIARRLAQTPWSGLAVRAFYDDDKALAGSRVEGVEVRGPVSQVARDLATDSIDQIWIALPLRADARIRELLLELRQHSVEVRLVPDIFNFALLNHSMTEVAGLPVINLTESPLSGVNRVVKAAEDFVLSLLLLVVASPLMLLIAVGVKLSSPGPVFYAQERVTWNGRNFRMKKFRTMPVGTEAATGPVWDTAGRAPGDSFRRVSAPVEPRRIAAAAQRADRRHVAGRSAAGAAGIRRAVPDSRFPATCRSIWSRRESPAGRRSTTCAGTPTSRAV